MKKLIPVLAAAVLAACTQIDTGNVGVESSMGQFKKEVLTPGVYFTAFKRVTEVSTKEILLPMEDMRPQTSDKITLTDLDVDIYVQIDPTKATDVITRWPGDISDSGGKDGSVGVGLNYIARQAREAIYSDIAKRGSATVHTERAAIASAVVKALQADLDASAGKGWFFVRSANVRNLVTDPALEANIKAAAAAQPSSRSRRRSARSRSPRRRPSAAASKQRVRPPRSASRPRPSPSRVATTTSGSKRWPSGTASCPPRPVVPSRSSTSSKQLSGTLRGPALYRRTNEQRVRGLDP